MIALINIKSVLLHACFPIDSNWVLCWNNFRHFKFWIDIPSHIRLMTDKCVNVYLFRLTEVRGLDKKNLIFIITHCICQLHVNFMVKTFDKVSILLKELSLLI